MREKQEARFYLENLVKVILESRKKSFDRERYNLLDEYELEGLVIAQLSTDAKKILSLERENKRLYRETLELKQMQFSFLEKLQGEYHEWKENHMESQEDTRD